MSDAALAYDVMAPVHEPRARDRALEHLRRTDPIPWDAKNGWWLVTRHADVRFVSSHPELFSSEPKGPWHVAEHRFSMQAMDGEPHVRHRNVVSKAFTPRMIATLAESAVRYADEAIDGLAGHTGCEFVTALAAPVPMRIIADMLGVADGDLEHFRAWGDAMIDATDPDAAPEDFERAATMIGELRTYLGGKVEERRAEPRDDVLGRIVQADAAGLLHDATGTIGRGALVADDVADMALFLLIAGNETTRNAISQGMLTLLGHPEATARLTATPSLWSTAADEILRWTSPVRAMRRVALRDAELAGRTIREGDSVVMVYASANRDDAVFTDPHTFDVARSPNDHLAFGFGPHFCLGANLARLELRAVLERILARLPGLRLAAAPVFTPSALIDGVLEMPVEW